MLGGACETSGCYNSSEVLDWWCFWGGSCINSSGPVQNVHKHHSHEQPKWITDHTNTPTHTHVHTREHTYMYVITYTHLPYTATNAVAAKWSVFLSNLIAGADSVTQGIVWLFPEGSKFNFCRNAVQPLVSHTSLSTWMFTPCARLSGLSRDTFALRNCRKVIK